MDASIDEAREIERSGFPYDAYRLLLLKRPDEVYRFRLDGTIVDDDDFHVGIACSFQHSGEAALEQVALVPRRDDDAGPRRRIS
jgi:hypothetical protein